jgi:eukaryotic-like serine/threonine-protein kinase
MKTTRPEASVPGTWELLRQSRLLTAEEVRALEERWRREARDPASLGELARWLTANQCATEYQVAMLLHGHADRFFLGPYKLLDRIGKGRLATVYRAVHRLGHLAAVKVLPPSKARDPGLLARFRAEVSLARRLDHPNVVRTLDAGEDRGLHYLVMEYLQGEDLQEVLDRRGRLGVVEAVHVVRQALLGLQRLSEYGLVHRNLEPANLMLVRAAGGEGEPPTVKLLDVSLSRACLDEAAEAHLGHPRWAGDGSVPGAPAYMAPEQARGPHEVDIRADVYSLGCILYHALAGRPPFVDADPLRLMILHATETPVPLTALNAEVPEGLAQIVGWMMARSPRSRYPSPERAAAALETFLLSATAPPPPPDSSENGPPPLPQPEAPPPPPSSPPAPAEPPRVEGPGELAGQAVQAQAGPGRRAASPGTRPTRRDYLCLLLGGVGLLLAQAVGWLLARLLSRRTRDHAAR